MSVCSQRIRRCSVLNQLLLMHNFDSSVLRVNKINFEEPPLYETRFIKMLTFICRCIF